MTTDERARLRELAAQATPGPWEAFCRDVSGELDSSQRSGLGWEVEGPPIAWNRGQFDRGQDALYIAAAHPQAVLAVLDALETAEARIAALEAAVEWVHMHTTGSWPSDPEAWMAAIRERCEEVMPELVESPGDGGDLYAALEIVADAARALIACERRATTEAYCDDEWAVLEAALAALDRGAGPTGQTRLGEAVW